MLLAHGKLVLVSAFLITVVLRLDDGSAGARKFFSGQSVFPAGSGCGTGQVMLLSAWTPRQRPSRDLKHRFAETLHGARNMDLDTSTVVSE